MGSLRVLLIDDDAHDLELFSERLNALTQPSYEVIAARNLSDAEQAIATRSIDLCLLDMDMEPVTGLEVLTQLKAAGLAAPVVMLTGSDDEDSDQACLDAGAEAFLHKRQADVRTLDRTLRYARALALKRAQLTLSSSIDPVTQALHRGGFALRLSQALQTPTAGGRGAKTCVAYFGIRGFKKINRRFGREVGDQVLRIAAGRLLESLGPTAVMGRMVGDEIAAYDSDTQRQQFAKRVQTALEHCAQPFVCLGRTVLVDMVAGISAYPYDAAKAAQLIERAEMAMQVAKDSKQPAAVRQFEIAHLTRLHYRAQLERELGAAIERQRLSIVFEPVFRTRTLEIVGAEVLSRWQHGNGQWISPGEFIPLAEQSDLILALTDSVIDKTAACLQQWRQAGLIDHHFRAYINVPAGYLQLPDAEARLLGPLRERDLPGQMLGLELTERSLLEMDDSVRSLLERLRAEGVTLVIDDFGVGFSSLSYLSELPVDQIKIDRSFLVAAQSNPRSLHIIRAIIALGASMNLGVLAEGIETQPMLDQVLQEGAEFMQGYLHGRSQTPTEFAHTLSTHCDQAGAGTRGTT